MIQRLNEIDATDSIHCLIYGPAGSGKTVICGTAGDRTLYCNVESRLATLQSKWFREKHKFNPFVITVTEPPLPDGGAKAFEELTNKMSEILNKHSADIDIIIIDGVTALRNFMMNRALEISQSVSGSKTLAKLQTINKGKTIDFIAMEMNDYKAEMTLMSNFIWYMKDYCVPNKKHFFMTAHERKEYTSGAKVGDNPILESVRPGFTGRTFPDDIPGLFDLVWHTETLGSGDQTKYYARTASDAVLQAKTCYGGIFKTKEENVNILEVIKRIKENRSVNK